MGTADFLHEITEIFAKNKQCVYAVGGYVRNKLLNIKSLEKDDVDLCSAVTPSELKSIFKNTSFEIVDKNASLGVCLIKKGDWKCEHATFRTENYDVHGKHTPFEVKFVKTIEEDCERRDFTINAIYLNLQTQDITDPFNGMKDLKQKIIKTVMTPSFVFNNDGVRILRMIRFASILGFNVDDDTFWVARRNACRVGMISSELIRKEFDKMLVADTFYPMLLKSQFGHLRAMQMIGELGLWRYILPIMGKLQESGLTTVRAPETVYEHSLLCMRFAPCKLRLLALLHDIGMLSPVAQGDKSVNVANISSSMIAEEMLKSKLNFSNSYLEYMSKVIGLLDYDKEFKQTPQNLRDYIIDNSDVIEDVVNLKIATIKAVTIKLDLSNVDCSLQKEYAYMQQHNIPTCIAELAINGTDIISNFPYLLKKNINNLQMDLLELTTKNKCKNEKEELLKVSRKLVKKYEKGEKI